MRNLISYEQAIEIMSKIYDTETPDVSVFVDRGWGDDPTIEAEYSIIKDGHGREPVAFINHETYLKLLENEIIGPNNLITFKARKNHQFLGDAHSKDNM